MRLVLLLSLLLVSSAASAQGTSGDAPAVIVSYDAGHSAALQFKQQDADFSFDRFREGFQAGIAGDSAQIAFAIGLRIGLAMSTDPSGAVDVESFLRGMGEGLAGTPSPYPARVVDLASRAVQDSVLVGRLRADAATNPVAAERLELIRLNGIASADFLAEVAARDDVSRTDTGVLYVVTEPGSGVRPTEAASVLVHYIGRFPDGTEFDRSEPDQPATFNVSQMVPGFGEMLRAMQPGESRTIFLPPSQAYGLSGSSGPNGEGGVPPNTALVFDLTLVSVVGSVGADG